MKRKKKVLYFSTAVLAFTFLGVSMLNINVSAESRSEYDGGSIGATSFSVDVYHNGVKIADDRKYLFYPYTYILGGIQLNDYVFGSIDDVDIDTASGITFSDFSIFGNNWVYDEIFNFRTNYNFGEVVGINSSTELDESFVFSQYGGYYDILPNSIATSSSEYNRIMFGGSSFTVSAFKTIRIADKRYNPNLLDIYEEPPTSSDDSSSGSEVPDEPEEPSIPSLNGYVSILENAVFDYTLVDLQGEVVASYSSSTNENVKPISIYNGVNFNNVYSYFGNLVANEGLNYHAVSINIVFDKRVMLPFINLVSNRSFNVLGGVPWSTNINYIYSNELDDSVTYFYMNSQIQDVENQYNENLYKMYFPKSSNVFSLYDGVNFNYIYGQDLFGLNILDSSNLYDSGYQAGYFNGNNEGYKSGYDNGIKIGREEAKQNAYNEGYQAGYEHGTSDDPYNISKFLYTVLDAPGRILGNMLNFDFLGVNLAGFFFALISLPLVIWLLKKFL